MKQIENAGTTSTYNLTILDNEIKLHVRRSSSRDEASSWRRVPALSRGSRDVDGLILLRRRTR